MNSIPTEHTIINSFELPKGYELLNYVIERKLEQSDFCITYLARETATNRAVVIKENFPRECSQRNTMNLTVGPSSAEDKELYERALTRFLDEAKELVCLSHPCLAPVLTAFKALGTAYYVMPLVEGQEIHKVAPAPEVINEEWLRPVLLPLLVALGYLHGEGLLHRNIKPSNILLRANGLPLLIDFGTACSSYATHACTREDSPAFSPTEQFIPHSKNGPWTDLYSLGAICYYLITGEAPQDAVGRVVADELVPLAGRQELQGRFSTEFLSAIDKALSFFYKDRWQSAQEWLDKLVPAKNYGLFFAPPAAPQTNAGGGVNDVGAGELIGGFIGGELGGAVGWIIAGLLGAAIGWEINEESGMLMGILVGGLIGGFIGWVIVGIVGGLIGVSIRVRIGNKSK